MDSEMWLGGLCRLQSELTFSGLMLQLPAASRRALGLTQTDRGLVLADLPGRNLEHMRHSSRQRFARATATAVDLIESGRMMAMGRGPFVCGIRPKTLLPRSERVQLTYSEPEGLPNGSFDFGPRPASWADWCEFFNDVDLHSRHKQYLKKCEPKVIRS
jgi:hypothetical protein